MHVSQKLILIAAFVTTSLTPSTFAQTPTPTFEVATVKPNNSGSGGSHTQFKGDGFEATNVTLKNMLQYQAFNISGPRIVGGPKWLDSQRFDIQAKLDAATIAQLKTLNRDQGKLASQAMFQQLLANRFQLKTHWEERELPVFALVPAKGGPKLQPAKDPTISGNDAGTGLLRAKTATMTQLAELLTQEVAGELGKVVVDKTGIAGTYDIALKWTPDTAAENTSAANAGPSLFTAIQEQLGLKLEPTKAPVKVLVIDRLEMPSEN